MTNKDIYRIRAGLLCLVASGVLSVIGLTLRGPIIDQAIAPAAFSQSAVAASFGVAWCFLLPSLCIQCFGWLALYAALKDTAHDSLAFWAMVTSISGNLLFLPFAGVIAFVTPEVGRQWLAGSHQAIEIANAGLAGPLALPFLILSAVLLLAGSVLVGILVWRAPGYPRWTAVPYIYHALALTFLAPLSYPAEYAGGLMLLLTSVAIARAAWIAVAAQTAGKAVSQHSVMT